MTIEEVEDLTSSTLSDSTQSPMTLSNISSSQQMSLSLHSEVSALSEAEKHEFEETVDSETDEMVKGYGEMQESLTQSEEGVASPLLIDEKCVAEMKDSEKRVHFPQEDTTTDIMYDNEQLSQSVDDSADLVCSLGDDCSLSFAHCTVDELSRGRPKEKTIEEEKEAASLTSSLATDVDSNLISSQDQLHSAEVHGERGLVETPTNESVSGRLEEYASSDSDQAADTAMDSSSHVVVSAQSDSSEHGMHAEQ